ncbi:MAG: D-sedoheptulose 7-phosphate isomerase [Planctomycetota bacterium]
MGLPAEKLPLTPTPRERACAEAETVLATLPADASVESLLADGPVPTPGSLDAVLLHDRLADGGDPEEVFSLAFQSLKEGGLAIVTEPEPTPADGTLRLHDPTSPAPARLGPVDRLLTDFAFDVTDLRVSRAVDPAGPGYVTVTATKPEHSELAAAFAQSARVKQRVAATMTADVAAAVDLVVDAIAAGGRVLACGNGGSAADAQHFAAEFVGRFLLERPAYAAIALTPDSSIMTAVGNDYGFETVFARQVEALGRPGDVFVGISTSGGSKNVVLAAEKAKANGLSVVALTGEKGRTGPLAGLADVLLAVPSPDTPRIQEAHIAILHTICEQAEKLLAADA